MRKAAFSTLAVQQSQLCASCYVCAPPALAGLLHDHTCSALPIQFPPPLCNGWVSPLLPFAGPMTSNNSS
jgi:hypothetical protein